MARVTNIGQMIWKLFNKLSSSLVLAIVVIIVIGAAIVFATRKNESSNPQIQFTQLPWQADEPWKLQTGPHNFVDGSLDGLDFVDTGDNTVRAVQDGVIIAAHNSVPPACNNPSCANNAGYVKEAITINNSNYVVEYWHLASIKVSVNQTVSHDDAIGIEGSTGYSIPSNFIHLFLAVTQNGKQLDLSKGTVSFGGWTPFGDKNTGYMQRGSQKACAANSSCAGDTTKHLVQNSSIPVVTNVAGRVFTWTSNIQLMDFQQLGVGYGELVSKLQRSDCSKDKRVLSNQTLPNAFSVVVLNNNAYIGDQGHMHYYIAYPDPCNGELDFGKNDILQKDQGAVGYVDSTLLMPIQYLSPDNPHAAWRNCWAPLVSATCSDGHLDDPNPPLGAPQFPNSVQRFDSTALYSWWTGSYWDPHWFHATNQINGQIAVYGRDWRPTNTPPPPSLSICPKSTAGLSYNNGISEPSHMMDSCGTPPPVSTTPPSGGVAPTTPPSSGSSTPPPVAPPSNPTDNSQWISNSSPISVNPGQRFAMSFTFQNDGNTTWDSSYALVCDTYYHANTNCVGNNSVSVNGSVSPGQQYTFSINSIAPSTPGTYQSWWSVAHNGSIFGNNNNYIQVTVNAPYQPSWKPYFSQNRPLCDGSGAWNGDVNHSATDDCSSSSGLVLSKYQSSSAELDLDCPNGNCNYNQTQFQMKVHVSLLNPGDTSVKAALLVQTPQNSSQYGGYILAVNSTGYWELQQVNTSNGSKIVVTYGNLGIDAGNFNLQITVQNQQLTAYINGQQVAQIGDNLNPNPGAVGLMEESPSPTSSAVLYNAFELDFWS